MGGEEEVDLGGDFISCFALLKYLLSVTNITSPALFLAVALADRIL